MKDRCRHGFGECRQVVMDWMQVMLEGRVIYTTPSPDMAHGVLLTGLVK